MAMTVVFFFVFFLLFSQVETLVLCTKAVMHCWLSCLPESFDTVGCQSFVLIQSQRCFLVQPYLCPIFYHSFWGKTKVSFLLVSLLSLCRHHDGQDYMEDYCWHKHWFSISEVFCLCHKFSFPNGQLNEVFFFLEKFQNSKTVECKTNN